MGRRVVSSIILFGVSANADLTRLQSSLISPETMAKTFLITGATGKQGRAVVDALLAASQDAKILALTRNIQSQSANALLLKEPNQIKLLEGDLKDCAAIFAKAACTIHGVFCVSIPEV